MENPGHFWVEINSFGVLLKAVANKVVDEDQPSDSTDLSSPDQEPPCTMSQPVAIHRFFLGESIGGLPQVSLKNINENMALSVKLEAGTGIEPVFTDLQSDLPR